jgi:hypothetical protein
VEVNLHETVLLVASYVILQSIISWTMVLSHHITRYSHTLTHIHILPQNSRHWPVCKSANVGVAAGNTAERYLQEGPVRLPLVAVTISSAYWNQHLHGFSFKWRKKKKLHIVRSGEYGGCGKTVTCCFPSSSWTSTEQCAGALSYSNSQFFLRQSSGPLWRIELRRRWRISL